MRLLKKHLLYMMNMIILLCLMVGITIANDAIIYDIKLTSVNCTYQLYLPAVNPGPGKYTWSDPDHKTRSLNTADQLRPLTYPIRVTWAIQVSNCADGENGKTPQFRIRFCGPDGSIQNQVVNESFYNDIRSGSFVLPANTGMIIETETGFWDQPFNSYTKKHNSYICRWQISYRTVDKDIPIALQHMDANVFNDYVAAMVKNKEPEMREALLKEENITGFKLQDAKFDIMTGKLTIQFLIFYKKTDIKGTLNFEIRASTDGAQTGSLKVGGYCLGLEGGLHSSKFLADIALAFTRNAINKRLVGREFWSDNQTHPKYKVFTNDNLTYIVNKAFVENQAGRQQFKKITASIPAGTLEAECKNIHCNLLDISTGRTQISFDLDAAIKPDLGFAINFDNAGSVVADFDLYIHCEDQSWWAKLNSFQLTIHGLPPELNARLQNIINQELNNRKVLIQIDMPQLK